MPSAKNVYVLYVDHKGHPAPLSSCYHATGTRRLSSSVERYPPSTLTEIDSAYCPQSLTSYDADYSSGPGAAQSGFSPKASCQLCPCLGTLTLGVAADANDDTKQVCFYQCVQCEWDSRLCNLTVTIAPEGGGGAALSRVELARAMEDLGAALQARRHAGATDVEQYTKSLTAAWDARTKKQQQQQQQSTTPMAGGASGGGMMGGEFKPQKSVDDGPEGWSVEALEASLKARQEKFAADTLTPLPDMAIERVPLDSEPPVPDEALAAISQLELELQSLNGTSVLNGSSSSMAKDDFLPLPMPFRARLSRRCRAELEEGRPGILLKPKLNPLEGDSSLRSGHGQWWKKDSSAIHVMPRIGVLKHEIKDNKYRIFLLKVTNPTLGPVRLRFASSSYQGEPDWDDPVNTRVSVLPDLLVDDLWQRHLTLQVNTSLLQDMARTESVELLSSEDSFIELGGKSREIPEPVKNWQPAAPTTGGSVMRLVASSASTAFFELALVDAAAPPSGHAVAVPLSLELEAGNGSWESSLIAKATDENEADWVPFDLVITWA